MLWYHKKMNITDLKNRIIFSYKQSQFKTNTFLRKFSLCNKLMTRYDNAKNKRNKKCFNFVLAKDFIEEFNCGKKIENPFDCKLDFYEFGDVYITCYGPCAFIHKIQNKKMYSFKEAAGINKRVDSEDFKMDKPLSLRKNVVEEDEVCLACFVLGENYWHFTCDILPKIMIMERMGYKGKYLVNPSNMIAEFMNILCIPPERIIYCQRGQVLKVKKVTMFDELYGIDIVGKLVSDLRQFIIERLEQKFGPLEDDKMPKKIYVSRIGSRRIINEKQLVNYLSTLGFVLVIPENVSIYEQIKLFYNADIIVCPHGANSTNILYSKRGSTFIECFGHHWVNPCMIGTIDLLSLDYHMLCERFADNYPGQNKYSDYVINFTLFKCLIEKVLKSKYHN